MFDIDILVKRWCVMMYGFGCMNEVGMMKWFNILNQQYTGENRHYHNLRHIQQALNMALYLHEKMERHDHRVTDLAIWFHDAIYDPTQPNNEQRSAELAWDCIRDLNLGVAVEEDTINLILATIDHKAYSLRSSIVNDADMSILIAVEPRYLEYVCEVRKEYAHVSDHDWSKGRREFLMELYKRNAIFSTQIATTEDWDYIAKSNIEMELRANHGVIVNS